MFLKPLPLKKIPVKNVALVPFFSYPQIDIYWSLGIKYYNGFKDLPTKHGFDAWKIELESKT